MKTTPKKSAGIALIAGSLLMVLTMILHPAGGDFQHLLSIFNIIVISHAVAMVSVPFSLVGFWGLRHELREAHFLSLTAFATITVGLLAALAAAAINGLALPLFVQRYAQATPETIDSLGPIMHYGSALNHACDFILIGAVCLSLIFWSAAILHTGKLPSWTGYFGLLLSSIALALFFIGFNFVDLQGFRWFIFGWVAWIAVVARIMIISP